MAVATSAMLRTCVVRLFAIEFTFWVSSRHTPDTPRTCACPPRMPSVPTSRATRVTSDANEPELLDHRVDGVLQLEDLALGLDVDGLGQVALGDGGGHLRDLAHLVGQVAGHQVHAVGQLLPHAGDAADARLRAQLAVDADLLGDAGDLGGERGELRHHAVDQPRVAQEVAAQRRVRALDVDGLAQIALGHRAQHARHVGGVRGDDRRAARSRR